MALKKKLRRLKNITVNEVSLVDRPANMRKFLLFKQQGTSDKIVNLPALPDDDDDDGMQDVIDQYEFVANLTEEKKADLIKRIKKCLGVLDSLKKSTLSESEQSVLVDIWRLEAGLLILKGRNPGLYSEFTKADSDQLKNDWVYTLDSQGIPLISKRIPQDNPFETKSHKFDPEMGRWEPKKR